MFRDSSRARRPPVLRRLVECRLEGVRQVEFDVGEALTADFLAGRAQEMGSEQSVEIGEPRELVKERVIRLS